VILLEVESVTHCSLEIIFGEYFEVHHKDQVLEWDISMIEGVVRCHKRFFKGLADSIDQKQRSQYITS